MSATTPILGLRYPVDTDDPHTLGVHTAVQNLANDFDQYWGAWTTWTPVVSQGATTNIAKTNDRSRYRVQGKLCEFEFRCALTGAGTASAKVTVSTPQNSRINGLIPAGYGHIFDTSVGGSAGDFNRIIWIDSGGNNTFVWRAGSGLLGAVDFTAALASGDIVEGTGFMELA